MQILSHIFCLTTASRTGINALNGAFEIIVAIVVLFAIIILQILFILVGHIYLQR